MDQRVLCGPGEATSASGRDHMARPKRPLRLVFAGLAAACALAFAAPAPATAEQVLRIGAFGSDAGRIDPHYGNTGADLYLISLMFDGLVRFPPGTMDPTQIEPDLAESWETSEDGRTWTFHLRQGVQFHGGFGEFTADDAVFSLERSMDPDRSAYAGNYAAFESVTALDDYTVEIKLTDPVPDFLGLVVNHRAGMVVSRAAAEDVGEENYHTRPIGTGPFAFVEYVPNQYVTLEAFEEHHRGRPQIDSILYRYIGSENTRELAFRNNEIDLFYGRREQDWVERMSALPEADVEIFEPAQARLLNINRSMAPLDDIRVRQAIAHAIDRDEFRDLVGRDITRTMPTVVPIGFAGHAGDLEPLPFDPDKSRELLAEAGYPDGFTVPALISQIASLNVPMQLTQEQLRRVGIVMDLEEMEHVAYHAGIRRNESGIVLYGPAAFPSAEDILTPFFHSRSTVQTPEAQLNFSHCSIADEVIEAASRETDDDRRMELYREAQILIMEDVCAIPIFELMQVFVRRANLELGYELEGNLNLGPPILAETRFVD